MVRMYICMGLVLCVDCGAFVRVRCLAVLWLVACLPMFYLFCILFSSSSHIFWGFAFVVLGLSSWLLGFCSWSCHFFSLWVVVSFSLTDYAQKERAHRVGASSLVLLWVCFPYPITLIVLPLS